MGLTMAQTDLLMDALTSVNRAISALEALGAVQGAPGALRSKAVDPLTRVALVLDEAVEDFTLGVKST